MKAFNPEKELRKIQHGSRNKVIFGIFLLLIIIGISSSYALYQVRYSKRIIYTRVAPFSASDLDLAVLIDGSPADDFPEKDDGKIYDKIDCGKTNVKAYWDYDKWALVLETNKKAKCTVYFKTGTTSAGSKLDTSGANLPELYDGLIPVKYEDTNEDGTPEIIVADKNSTDWYNYDAHEWANAVLIDNTKVAVDLSGNGNHGKIVGGAKITNEGLELDGNDDGIYLGDMIKDFFKKSNTIQIKMKKSDNSQSNFFGNYSTPGSYIVNYDIINGKFQIWRNNSWAIADGEFNLIDNFILLSIVYDSDNGKIIVYNNQEKIFESTNNFFPKTTQDFLNVYIGREYSRTEVSLKGTIEKVMIYDKMLSDDEVKQNATAQSGKVGNGGVVADKLHLYYDFKAPQEVNTTPGEVLGINAISQMYVWIPRYKYQLWNVNNSGIKEQMINVRFEKGTNSTGDVSCTTNLQGKEECTNALNGNWYTHPAFKFGNTELPGIWVGKFEASDYTDEKGYNTSIGEIAIIPDRISMVNKNVKVMFEASRNIESSSGYGLQTNQVDTHLIKNMEWGAVAYLSNSKYGIYERDGATCTIQGCNIYKNNTTNGNEEAWRGSITGCAGSSAEADAQQNLLFCPNGRSWNTVDGVKASTTGNVYGIYDMSGGDWEYVMANMARDDGTFYTSSSTFPDKDPLINSKYYDVYAYSTSSNKHELGHLGDATRETLAIFGDSYGGWNSDTAVLFSGTNSWILRGGRAGWVAGIFSTYYTNGSKDNYYSLRVVLTAQDGNDLDN